MTRNDPLQNSGFESTDDGCALRNIVGGFFGGLLGAFAMNQFQSLVSKASKAFEDGDSGQNQSGGNQDEDATIKTARALSKTFRGKDLAPGDEKWAGPAVHYGFGALSGGIYGGLAGRVPYATAASGTLFGTALWLAADEIAVPALGLSSPPSESTLSTHVNALASHLVYGVVTDLVRRGIGALRCE